MDGHANAFCILLLGLLLEKDELKQLFANDHSNRKSIWSSTAA